MPVLKIELIKRPGEKIPADLSDRLARSCSRALRAEPGRTWVRLHTLAAEGYAEDGGTPEGLAPVFVEVLLSRWPRESELVELAERLSRRVGVECDRPAENVHILFLPEAVGRIAFGGSLLPPTEPH